MGRELFHACSVTGHLAVTEDDDKRRTVTRLFHNNSKIMKKILVLLGVTLAILALSACSKNPSITAEVNNPSFQLYPTDNLWTFIKLDTRTGKMWQVQFDIKGSNRGEVVLNEKSLAEDGTEENGRFSLSPTKNMFTFILLDQQDGSTWQVQWSIDKENRLVLPISNN